MNRDTLRESQWPTRGQGDPAGPRGRRHYRVRPLSPHERAFLCELANGATIRSVAAAHGVSDAYVNKAVLNVKVKLGALSMPHAIALAFSSGILRPEDIRPP